MPYIAEYLIGKITKKNLKKLNKIIIEDIPNKIKKNKQKSQTSQIAEQENNIQINENIQETKNSKISIDRNPNLKWIFIMFIICIFIGLCTPIKDIPYTYMIKSIQGNTMNFISEHQAVVLINHIGLLGIFVIIIMLLFSNKIKIKLHDVFMLGGMAILSLISYKQFPIFFICTMCIINKLVLTWIQETKNNKKNKLESMNKEKKKHRLENILPKILKPKGIIFILLIITIVFLLDYRKIITQDYVDKKTYPVAASEWINQNIDKENMKLFNDFNYGSYLLFNDIKVFIDGRADVYDPKFNGKQDDSFLAYMMTTSLKTEPEEVFKKYGITHIITTNEGTFNMMLSKEKEKYKEIYSDETFKIYKIEQMQTH